MYLLDRRERLDENASVDDSIEKINIFHWIQEVQLLCQNTFCRLW